MTHASLLLTSAVIVLLSAGCGKKDVRTAVAAGPGGSVQYTARGAGGETAQITARAPGGVLDRSPRTGGHGRPHVLLSAPGGQKDDHG